MIKLSQVSKKFYQQHQKTFKEFLPALIGGQNTISSFWALKNINLSVAEGETLGIIGVNGSGKSTLLEMMAGVSQPTSGTIHVDGRIAPLIELGAGFHPELTGRENVFLNGIILGLSRQQVTAQFDEIVNFAEIPDFIDQPIKHYSSGMYLRLAFAVAVHTNPDILLMDEILAVGDTAFQKKCFAKMKSFQDQGKTIVFVSHDLNAVENFCQRAIWLEKGEIKAEGKAKKVVATYRESI